MERIDKLVVVGVGLIGGSFALALKEAHAVRRVVGVGRSAANIYRAQELKIIDAEGAFDRREGLIGAHRGFGVEFGLRYRGAQHVDAVEPGFGLDRGIVAGEGEFTVGDGAGEVLGHLLAVEHDANRLADRRRPAQRPAFAANPGLNGP